MKPSPFSFNLKEIVTVILEHKKVPALVPQNFIGFIFSGSTKQMH